MAKEAEIALGVLKRLAAKGATLSPDQIAAALSGPNPTIVSSGAK
jgi:hypothetical protein